MPAPSPLAKRRPDVPVEVLAARTLSLATLGPRRRAERQKESAAALEALAGASLLELRQKLPTRSRPAGGRDRGRYGDPPRRAEQEQEGQTSRYVVEKSTEAPLVSTLHVERGQCLDTNTDKNTDKRRDRVAPAVATR